MGADPEAIHQVFSNLVDNALKYAHSGGRIVLGARPVSEGVEFYVQDFGPGIPSEHLPRLFERFLPGRQGPLTRIRRHGAGLAIAKHIVLAHRGIIRAQSELNHGSIFLFTLPLAYGGLRSLDAKAPVAIGDVSIHILLTKPLKKQPMLRY